MFLPISDAHELDLMGIMEYIVLPVLRTMTKPGEVESLSLTWEQPAPATAEPGQPAVLMLEVVLRDERFQTFVWSPSDPPSSPTKIRSRIASELQDFVAESRFGWGSLRRYNVE